ncbi:hypothetical protein [Zwartia sp.]|uniref:hypothetical protein n=1 Tax=Zwartia sp. TaxID=2978004 RepID=UPI002715A059|nr:hypothetical protein [Zwartia sp.]MDO9024615.1 hypothetical protein [Zwartia sp.]
MTFHNWRHSNTVMTRFDQVVCRCVLVGDDSQSTVHREFSLIPGIVQGAHIKMGNPLILLPG